MSKIRRLNNGDAISNDTLQIIQLQEPVNGQESGSARLEVTGDFDGGSVYPFWVDTQGSAYRYKDSGGSDLVSTTPTFWDLTLPPSLSIGFELVGTTNTGLAFIFAAVRSY